MSYDRFLIAPFNTGLETDLKPWLIPEDAFQKLQNAYIFRGRVRKRVGSTLMPNTTSPLQSRFRILIGTTPGPINLPNGASQLAIGQAFSVGADIFTVYQLVAGVLTLSTNAGATATINSTTNPNTVTFTGEPGGTNVFYYPANPVMGLPTFENGPIDDQPLFGFDTQFAYFFVPGTGWSAAWTGTFPIWHGTNSQFFWAENYWGADVSNPVTLFVTNYNYTQTTKDPIWTYDTTNHWVAYPGNTSAQGFYFRPTGAARYAGPWVQTALMIVSWKNRLIFLSTVESISGTLTVYPQRARYSINGSPFLQNSWYEPGTSDTSGSGALSNAAGAGFTDATTDEQITSCEFIKDRLIVYFERSTWELVYTGNQVQPFIWQKINTELGSTSQFSTVPFDKTILTVGLTGIHACSGANVERIDNKIPDEIFDIEVAQDARVYGIRDYFTECVYWTFVNQNQEPDNTFPNAILLYNYRNNTWALWDDCITAFGYYEQQLAITWANSNSTWAVYTAEWDSGSNQPEFRQVVGGNQEGFTFVMNSFQPRNAPVMQITNIAYTAANITLTVVNHNLTFGDYIAIENVQGLININAGGLDSTIGIYQVDEITDANTVVVVGPHTNLITGAYTGGGTVARVSNLNIWSKQWNPYVNKARDVYVAKIDFGVEKTDFGQVTVDYFTSSSEFSTVSNQAYVAPFPLLMGTNILETNAYANVPFELEQERLWHPIYFQSEGFCIQIRIFMAGVTPFTATQIGDTNIAWSDFQLEGVVLWTQPTTSRLQ